ncbi:hypothetical protein [Methylobacter tundripaludum]|uniref:Uncharacterized protein n=1 Tax=Methylobacter tundripaludum (strain ATCC BAA-1195 / DSM 17260 / SV96) TaxID=697282 RepID=G3IRB8_METTV|nr:hypothetical protein [Methylobacter tundripaludum]EGW22129.1 hypothetical protein Mettu_0930 [Methylobacter tundripaludum SV96]
MQTPLEQYQSNLIRISAYRAKQTDEQRRRADLAEQVNVYCKKLGLNMPQSITAIRIALEQLRHGCSDDLAYEFGTNTARIIALVSANQKLSSIIRRKVRVLH